MSNLQSGTVYLIGAGPGDPGLITLRGAEILGQADVIVYDRLAHPRLLMKARADAEHVYVGKASANHAMKQTEINLLLVDRASKGLSVARLKGGDPFVFGRGGEEAEYCRANGVRFEIVPGVTSAIAAAAYAGIPVTHRDAASSFAVITGHERDDDSSRAPAGAAEGRRNWRNISWAADTLVFLMGFENLTEISKKLIENGREAATPVALIQWGTWSSQKVVTGTLESIVSDANGAGISNPAVCIVGEVVRLRESLRWFDNPQQRPLLGKRILVTRAREQASALSDMLRELGAEAVEFPTIRVEARLPNADLDMALRSLKDYCWLVFTSPNAVRTLSDTLKSSGLDSRVFSGLKIAAIGPATAAELEERLCIHADYLPTEAVAEAALEQWPDLEIAGKRVLIPQAAEARDVLPMGLRALGAIVEVVPVYDTVIDSSGSAALREQLESGTLHALTFTSSSTVTNFIHALGDPRMDELRKLTNGCVIAAIGPITGQTLHDYGIDADIIAKEHTLSGLVAELSGHFCKTPIAHSDGRQ